MGKILQSVICILYFDKTVIMFTLVAQLHYFTLPQVHRRETNDTFPSKPNYSPKAYTENISAAALYMQVTRRWSRGDGILSFLPHVVP